MDNEVICLSCPNGCRISVKQDRNGFIFEGAKCERGESYAYQEVTDPKRVVTAVIRTNSEILPYIPVKTDKPISKKYVRAILKEIYKHEIKLPVRCGDVVISNFMDTGVNVVVTRSFPL
ncbi:MAG: DUF1667 domain-containing protein [Candidatus Hydrogenedentes bacterium]|nr:DUF1667 domain-containing protein [Candidatus Hydrogenedentota bacterium]